MKQIEHVKILVVGDIMLDKYVVGDVSRISPEAPVPVVHVSESYHTLGGCGNVVRNLREIGAQVDCLASIGLDEDGERIISELKRVGARDLCVRDSKETTVKERIVANSRKIQMLRVDRETITQINQNKLIAQFRAKGRDDYDMIIISDYAKGVIGKEIMTILKNEQNADIIVDPKPINGFLYDNVFMITPNEKEWDVMQLASQYSLKHVSFILETKGRHGMILHDQITGQDWPVQSTPVEVYNVSGAGDTVIAVTSICLSMGFAPFQAAVISNACAAYVVTQPGTTTVPKNVFLDALDMFKG